MNSKLIVTITCMVVLLPTIAYACSQDHKTAYELDEKGLIFDSIIDELGYISRERLKELTEKYYDEDLFKQYTWHWNERYYQEGDRLYPSYLTYGLDYVIGGYGYIDYYPNFTNIEICSLDKSYLAYYQPQEDRVVLCLEFIIEEYLLSYNRDEFAGKIDQVMLHEYLHGIHYHLGLQELGGNEKYIHTITALLAAKVYDDEYTSREEVFKIQNTFFDWHEFFEERVDSGRGTEVFGKDDTAPTNQYLFCVYTIALNEIGMTYEGTTYEERTKCMQEVQVELDKSPFLIILESPIR